MKYNFQGIITHIENQPVSRETTGRIEVISRKFNDNPDFEKQFYEVSD